MVVTTGRRVIYLATQNENKIREIEEILGEQWEIRQAADLDPHISWEETGQSFEENAKIKAIEVNQLTNDCILAEDSGLCVEALGGEPGIYANRYAGKEGDHKANIAKLLDKLQGVPSTKRKAYFVCCLVYIDEQGSMQSFEGRCYGTVTEAPRGEKGFGYDPVFLPEGYAKTMAEITPEEKNAISHRRKALEKWAHSLEDL